MRSTARPHRREHHRQVRCSPRSRRRRATLSLVRYYPVYSDQPRGNAGYCAWHSCGTINGIPRAVRLLLQARRRPGLRPAGHRDRHSQGLAALGNVSGHELSETLTDPHCNAWYDQQGDENADKCAWTFGGTGHDRRQQLEDPGQLEQRSRQHQQRLRQHRRLHRDQQHPLVAPASLVNLIGPRAPSADDQPEGHTALAGAAIPSLDDANPLREQR